MLFQLVLAFLCGVGVWATENTTTQQEPPPLLLVSFDGFRADYLKRFPMPNLKLLYSQGVLVEQLTNVFITKTFPNHYSLVSLLLFVCVCVWKMICLIAVSNSGLKTFPSFEFDARNKQVLL